MIYIFSDRHYLGDYRHGILVSTDNGATWVSLGLANYRADKLVAVNPENLNIVYATVQGYGLFKTSDGGANWQNLNSQVSGKYFTRLLVNRLNPDQVFVATLKSGLFISNSAGSSWEHLGPENANVAALAFNEQEGRLFFSVLDEPYVYIVDVDSIFASVENRSRGVPHNFQLLQNYPNPFNAETWIRYNLRDKEKATIAIYNVSGRKVRTLIEDDQLPGTHRVKWNGRDDWGREVSSGVYVCQLRAGQKSLTRKLLLLR